MGRLLWLLLLVTYSVLVAEVTPAWEVAQLPQHTAAAAKQALFATQSWEVTKSHEMMPCCCQKKRLSTPACCQGTFSKAHLAAYLANAKPIQFTELAEDK